MIKFCLLPLVFFCSVAILAVPGYADSRKGEPVKLPQGVRPVSDELSAGQTDIKADTSETMLKNTNTSVGALPAKKRPFESKEPAACVKVTPKKAEGPKIFSCQKEGLAELRAYVDKSNITIGEKLIYTLEIDADNSLKVEFPSYVSGLGGFAVKDFGKDNKKIGHSRFCRTQWYLLDTYTTGSYVIPEQSVKVELPDGRAETLKSPQIFVNVKSVMGKEGEKAGLRDIKEPLTVKSAMPPALIVIIIIIALGLSGAALCILYFKRRSRAKTEPVLTPREIAVRELERIEGMRLIDNMRIKEYYYLVSLVLRKYLEGKFSLKAPESTTEEFLESVAGSDKLEGKYINILKEYLNHCDLVKYAKFNPGKSQARALIDTTHRFIEETSVKDDNDSGDKTTEV